MGRPKKNVELGNPPEGGNGLPPAFPENEVEFVTKEVFDNKFNSLEGSILQLVEMMKPKATSELGKKLEETKETAKAVPDLYQQVPPDWDSAAREILGEVVDHCEVKYRKEGGIEFTVVIKKEFSNAKKEYLERMKADRRTCEVGKTGQEGVTQWCKRIKQNLNQK